MITSFDEFFSDYRIKNNQAPNETVLNTGLLRLKRELRELKSVLDIVVGNAIEEYNPEKPYEIDEYVKYRGYCYKSRIDVNIANTPEGSQFWTKLDFPSLKEIQNQNSFHYLHFTASEGQTVVELPTDSATGIPCVFVEGILLNRSEYYIEGKKIHFYKACKGTETITILYTMAFESGYVLPSTELTASANQYIFNTSFDTYYASVFKNGILQSPSSYTIGKNQVSLEVPCKAGDKIRIVGGTLVGVNDLVNIAKLNSTLQSYYTKSETFSKAETNAQIDALSRTIYSDPNIVKSTDIYTKAELNSFLNNKVDLAQFNNELSTKANKATSLSGYNIENAYTKDEVDSLLNKKITDSAFDGNEIAKRLNTQFNTETPISVTKISGYNIGELAVQNQQADFKKAVNIKGGDSQNVKLQAGQLSEYPKLKATMHTGKYNEISGDIINGLTSKNKFITIQGEFSGTFETDIHRAGIVNPEDYNWTVQVIPNSIPVKTKHDFVPKGFGSGFTYKAFNENVAVETSYFYGFVKDNILKCYAYAESGNTLRKWYAHYVLTGIDKTLSTNIYLNQTDSSNEYIKFAHESFDEFDKKVNSLPNYGPITSHDVKSDNALSLISGTVAENSSTVSYKSNKPGFFSPKIVTEKDTINGIEKVNVSVVSGLPYSSVKITVSGDAEIDIPGSIPSNTNNYLLDSSGEVTFAVMAKSPYKTSGVITLTSSVNESCSKSIKVVAPAD